ncbi:MAG TPA: hypothetical protein VGL12_15875 [Roseiarcus sp.]|jgi:hypothetical protein
MRFSSTGFAMLIAVATQVWVGDLGLDGEIAHTRLVTADPVNRAHRLVRDSRTKGSL